MAPFYVDAFSGHTMTPELTLNFLSLFSPGSSAALAPCSPAALFVRMYRNLMNLYQNPQVQRNRGALAQAFEPQQAEAYTHYEMEAHLHHCASQILELMRLAGEHTPDVLTSMFVERFRYAGGMEASEQPDGGQQQQTQRQQ